MAKTHWLVLYDPEDGEPYGEVCDCGQDEDHNVGGTRAAW